jgi:hypothetical protein
MANRQSSPLVDVMKQMKAREAWRQRGSERWEHYAGYDLKEAGSGELTGNTFF